MIGLKKVSVILPVYNSEKYINKTVDSILQQTYKKFELIIINDGSTDDSGIICEKLKDKDKRIKYISKENSGVSDTRNLALSYATGDYVTFIDSDDLYENDFLKIMVANIENYKADIVICAYKSFNTKEIKNMIKRDILTDKKEEIIESLQPTLLFNQIWNKIYKKKILKDNKIIFDKELSIAEDLKFNIEYLKCCNKIFYVNKCLYKYRISRDGLGFKFRTDANQVKIDLVRALEPIYSKVNNKDYLYKSYLKQYISYLARVMDKRNNITFEEKIREIKKINNSKLYRYDIKKILKSNNITLKIIARLLLSKSILTKILLAYLATLYDKNQKRRIFKVLK